MSEYREDAPVAVITGGGTGVGGATTRRMAKRGCNVVVVYRSSTNDAEDVARDCRTTGVEALTVRCDVAEDADCRAVVDRAKETWGHIDVMVNSAGMTHTDIDLYEVDEAFASVPMAWLKKSGADPNKLNVNGDATGLGHPLGTTGTKLMTTLVHALRIREKRFGPQTMCEGGGIANVTIIERCWWRDATFCKKSEAGEASLPH